MIKKIVFATGLIVAASFGLEITTTWLATGQFSVGTPAEARIGRPLTPVSVAGVVRRTVRRCAVGVYYC